MNTEMRMKALAEKHFHVSVARDPVSHLHGHDFLELSYITKGSMRHLIDGQSSVLTAGDYFIVDYGTKHAYESTSDTPLEVVNLLFYPEFLERTLAGRRRFEDVVNSYLLRFQYKTLRSSPTGKTFQDMDGQILAMVESICREYKEKPSGYLEYIRCRFLEILILTMRQIGIREGSNARSDMIKEITDTVKAEYAQKLRLSDVAEKYNYSVSYLSRKFTEEIGMGFSEYVQKIRIEQSCRLLENTQLHVSEIARQVGYENLKFFNRVFKAVLGTTPREFRKARMG